MFMSGGVNCLVGISLKGYGRRDAPEKLSVRAQSHVVGGAGNDESLQQ